jgi:hypothetical protein
MKLSFLIILLIFLSSCGGSLKVTGRGCQAFNAQFVNANVFFKPNFTWQRKVWTFGGTKESAKVLTLSEIMSEKKIECRNLSFIRYQISQSFWDQIFSVFPFVQRMTLQIEAQTKS